METVLLGPIFKKQGWNDSPFNLFPSRGKYMWKDMKRRSRKYGIGFVTVSKKRATCLQNHNHKCIQTLDILICETFCANFEKGLDISNPEVLILILNGLGVKDEEIVENSKKEETKNLLRKQTERAIELGIFGAPGFLIGEGLFGEMTDWKMLLRN